MPRVVNKRSRVLFRIIQVLVSVGIAVLGIGSLIFVTHGHPIPVLQPAGIIADRQRDLILLTTGLGVLVVVPVFIMLFFIAWKYRAGNENAKYEPDYKNTWVEAIWWGIPCFIILVLGIITGIATHKLDPYQPIDSNKDPVTVQVVALQWRWLFIYPDQDLATIDYMNIPKDTPINLEITSDAPMNSFWVPALAGQVYAMSGMSTQLHFDTSKTGSYNGVSANIRSDGFSDMTFKVNSMSDADFKAWVGRSSGSSDKLTYDRYKQLAVPNTSQKQSTFMLVNENLYNQIIERYMSSSGSSDAKSDKSNTTKDSSNDSMDMDSMPGMKM